MADYFEIKKQDAYVDENGAVFVPLRGNMMDKHQRKEHDKVCYKTLPSLDIDYYAISHGAGTMMQQEERVNNNRALLACRQPCCGSWWRPVEYDGRWCWVRVDRWTLRRWRKKGLL